MSAFLVDDTNTTAVTYSGVWYSGPPSAYYNNSAHLANSTTESKVTCIFTGITVRVFGLANNNLSSYTIDGSNTTFPDATRSIYDILLYTSPILLDGQHNLTIDANNLTIDYFLVTPSGNTSTSRTATFMSSTFDTQPTDTSSMDLAKTRQSDHKKSIIGAVVALAIVAFLGGLFLWLRRRRKNSESWGVATFDDRYTVHRPVGYTPVLPATHPEMIEQPLSPPGYPMSEPPPYDAADAEHWTDAPVVRS